MSKRVTSAIGGFIDGDRRRLNATDMAMIGAASRDVRATLRLKSRSPPCGVAASHRHQNKIGRYSESVDVNAGGCHLLSLHLTRREPSHPFNDDERL